MTQYALAKAIGIDQTHLRKIEQREIASPGVRIAMAIAEALGCTVENLFGKEAA